MKTLTLKQPWASLVALGEKRIETRSWRVSYRGPLAIHSSARFAEEDLETALTEPFASVWKKHGIETLTDLPLGSVLAVCRLTATLWTGADGASLFDLGSDWIPTTGTNERAFGNYGPGRYGWRLEDVCPLTEPIPTRGNRLIWEFEHPDLPIFEERKRCWIPATKAQTKAS